MRPRIKSSRFESDFLFGVNHMLNILVTFFQLAICRQVIDPKHFCCMSKADRFSVECDANGSFLVPSLFMVWSPSAIFRRVVTVVVDSFNRMVLGCFAHIQKELLKVVSPLIANNDFASAVTMKVAGIWIIASSFHPTPDVISSALAFAVGSALVAGGFCFKTSAATAMSASEIASSYRFNGSAFALTNPGDSARFADFPPFYWILMKYGPFEECMSCQVNVSHVGHYRLLMKGV